MTNLSLLANIGTVISVHGSVVDIRFNDFLPSITTLLRAGRAGEIAIEVMAQLDRHRVRGIALTPTQGLARGMPVEDTGGPLMAPVGREILSRMFDVFGRTIDRLPEPTELSWRTVHQAPPSISRRSTKSEIFETGIKVIDVLMPLERGGKAGLFGGAGVGKTVLLTEMIHNMVGDSGHCSINGLFRQLEWERLVVPHCRFERLWYLNSGHSWFSDSPPGQYSDWFRHCIARSTRPELYRFAWPASPGWQKDSPCSAESRPQPSAVFPPGPPGGPWRAGSLQI